MTHSFIISLNIYGLIVPPALFNGYTEYSSINLTLSILRKRQLKNDISLDNNEVFLIENTFIELKSLLLLLSSMTVIGSFIFNICLNGVITICTVAYIRID